MQPRTVCAAPCGDEVYLTAGSGVLSVKA